MILPDYKFISSLAISRMFFHYDEKKDTWIDCDEAFLVREIIRKIDQCKNWSLSENDRLDIFNFAAMLCHRKLA